VIDRRWSTVALLALPILAACGSLPGGSAPISDEVDDALLSNVDARPGEWLTHGRDYAETRYSPLRQINDGNVADLGIAFVYETGTDRGLEATPLVHNGILYTTLPWSVVQALDARTGALIWEWDPQVDRAWGQLACCDVVNRGVALYRGRVYVGTLDGRLAALDAKTGQLLWEVVTTDQSQPYTITGAPRVIRGKVVIGNGGAEYGVRGYVSAYDAETGELVWRWYTVPGNPAGVDVRPRLGTAAESALGPRVPFDLKECQIHGERTHELGTTGRRVRRAAIRRLDEAEAIGRA